MKHVPVRINNLMNGVQTFYHPGATILQYFAVFQTPYGISSQDISQSLALSPGRLLMAGLVAAVFLFVFKRMGRVFYWHLGLSLFLLFMASDLFPWNFIGGSSRIGEILTQVQYPWRYLSLATVTLALLLGDVLEELGKELPNRRKHVLTAVFISCGAIAAAIFAGQYANGVQYIQFYDQAELELYGVMGGEYLLQDVNPRSIGSLPGGIDVSGMDEVLVEEHTGTQWQLYCKACENGGQVTLPVFAYKGYQIKDDAGVCYAAENNGQGRLAFFLPSSYEGRIRISFESPLTWRGAETISFFSFLCGCLWVIHRYGKRFARALCVSAKTGR